MRSKQPLGVYVHVPFCAAKCAYCDFYSLPGRAGQYDAYIVRLLAHIAQAAERCGAYVVDTVYFGGGTPSLLGGARIARVLDALCAAFDVAPDAEITLEANPDSASDELLRTARAAGVNRLSMGVQSAHDDELRALGRIHTFAQARDAVTRARRAGFDNLSVDLMYALPGQTQAQLAQSIDALLALEPSHLSCYGLTVEPDTPLGRSHPTLPDEDAQADMYLMLCDRMARAGYEHYEISNFARPGRRSRHNSRYWRQQPYLGLGPGAHSDFEGRRMVWPRDLTAWLAGDARPVSEDDDIDRAAEYLMLSLRTSDGWDARHYRAVFGRDPQPVIRALTPLLGDYVIRTGDRWHLTDAGFLLSNTIILTALDAVGDN